MANSIVLASSRRVNVLPTSTILNQRFEDVDCSGTDFAVVPEDGQFILAAGKTGVNPYTGYTFAHATDPAGLTTTNLAYAMVYTGGSNRSDIQALGSKRIPVIRGNMRVKTKAFIVPDPALDLDNAGNGYAEGALLTLGSIESLVSGATVQGSDQRVFLVPVSKAVLNGGPNFATAAGSAVVVARVARVITDSAVAGTGEIEIELFQHPYVHNVDANP